MSDEKQSQGFFGSASPQLTFVFGLVLGLAVVSLIGFVFLLTQRGKVSGEKSAVALTAPVAAPAPTEDPGERVGNFRSVTDDDHIRGVKTAGVTLLEYSDTECPFCKQFHTTMNEILTQYDGKVRWVYRHFPLRGLHRKAAKEAEATECAAELGGNQKFWEYVDRLFAITPSNDGLDAGELPKIATAIGLNEKKFVECLESGKHAAKVAADEQDAVGAGGRGTPYTIVLTPDGQKIPVGGAVPTFELQALLDQFVK